MTASTNSHARWQAAGQDSIAWRAYRDGYVAYHRPSGKTHFLNAAGYALLSGLLDRPTSADELAAALVGDSGLERPPVDELADTLEHFAYLGLVDRVA